MHDKNLKRFRVSLRDLHPSLDASVSITRRQYPTNVQRATRAVLHKIEVFDRYLKKQIIKVFILEYKISFKTLCGSFSKDGRIYEIICKKL